MAETVRTASVLEIYNEAMKVLGEEKKSLRVELAKLKTKSFFTTNMLRGMALILFIAGIYFLFADLSHAPITNILFIAAVLIFYIKKRSLVKQTTSQTKSFFSNLHKNMFSGVIILSLIVFVGMPVLVALLEYFNLSVSYFLIAGAFFFFNFTSLHAIRIKEINNRLVAIDSEVEDLKKKKEAMLKQSLSEADEFLTNKN